MNAETILMTLVGGLIAIWLFLLAVLVIGINPVAWLSYLVLVLVSLILGLVVGYRIGISRSK